MDRREFIEKVGVATAGAVASQFVWNTSDSRAAAPPASTVADIHRYIAERKDQHIAKLQELLRQPSISSENVGIKECAELLRQ